MSFLSFFFSLPATHNLAFVFMVGDGILNVTLHSPVPLNDNEWHFVQAEINVKLARIKVDYQPWAVKRFPGQTFVTMEFTHPLLVGKLLGNLECKNGTTYTNVSSLNWKRVNNYS